MSPTEDSDDEQADTREQEEEQEAELTPEPAKNFTAGGAADVDDEDGGEEELEVDADGWTDLMDKKIKKKTIKEGEGGHPEMKQDVRCSVEIHPADAPADSEPLMRWPEMRYRIGETEAIPALELGLRYMKEGEEADIFGISTMAWGSTGLKAIPNTKEKAIPPDCDVRLRVKLIEVMGVGEGGASSKSWNDLIQEVTWRKTNGNDYYKRQEYLKALRSYGAGVKLFTDDGMEPPEHTDEADRERVQSAALTIVADCGSNLAACHLELGNIVEAKGAAQTSLDIRPEHMKSLYRLAKAALQLDEFELCESALQRGLKLEAQNAALLQVQADLNHKKLKYQARSKKVAGKVFADMDYPDLIAEKAKAEEEYKKMDTWSYWFMECLTEWFDRTIVGAFAVCALFLAVALYVLPKHQWPVVLIMWVGVVPIGLGIYTGIHSETSAAEKKAKDEKKKS
mmetsp:Transcript_37374/g.79293  ORF Transcript_37374/g.79293 Transcript_37374/m.79293 type:complete len:454 (+) Transcript_37374:107-1468(+)|eukprot:CAMPEP_0206436572 /NCGR_PEP_ID=MMETSP0324_2-20121206/10556_1 /ASSEMBLY_ACC=CAM_ASM_000836 /TAXON_ID=2866 /ORGANISM="Crypthecodinium cohnii, Strain Seligo" /LENGTH=453 /DNA_ID=CAMNT_0053903749 /DNA_START=53 /DNA_END=1414 /DNA_ORIENTATION=+